MCCKVRVILTVGILVEATLPTLNTELVQCDKESLMYTSKRVHGRRGSTELPRHVRCRESKDEHVARGIECRLVELPVFKAFSWYGHFFLCHLMIFRLCVSRAAGFGDLRDVPERHLFHDLHGRMALGLYVLPIHSISRSGGALTFQASTI